MNLNKNNDLKRKITKHGEMIMVQCAICQSARKHLITHTSAQNQHTNALYINFFLIVAEDCFIGIENYAPALILWPCENNFHFLIL